MAITKFNKHKKKSILCCIVDNIDTYNSGWAREISVNITDYLIHRFDLFKYDIIIGKDENELLKEASTDKFYSHAIVIASGMSLGLSDRLFPAIDELCTKDFFVAGHVLDRGENSYWQNAYYELHHQFYVVRLADYIELGCPKIGDQEAVKHTQIKPDRSDTCLYNDQEVAEWILPGTVLKEYNMKCHGWNIISVGLANNKKFIDLGNSIRESKKYLYFEHDHVFLRQMSDVYYNQFFCNNFYAAWNSDQYKESLPFDGPIEQYITVGIGLYWVTYLEKIGITDNTKVVFTDINYNCLQFMRALVTEWDGVDYPTFYKEHLPQLPVNFAGDLDGYINSTRKQWEEFVIDYPDWISIWNKIKKLNFDFILIDYMSTYNLDWIESGKRTLINLSDVFTHSPYIATQSTKYRISCENKLINKIQEVDPNINIMMTSRASDGFHPTQHRIMTGPVSEFDLTDINELNTPPWHINDWVSPKILG